MAQTMNLCGMTFRGLTGQEWAEKAKAEGKQDRSFTWTDCDRQFQTTDVWQVDGIEVHIVRNPHFAVEISAVGGKTILTDSDEESLQRR